MEICIINLKFHPYLPYIGQGTATLFLTFFFFTQSLWTNYTPFFRIAYFEVLSIFLPLYSFCRISFTTYIRMLFMRAILNMFSISILILNPFLFFIPSTSLTSNNAFIHYSHTLNLLCLLSFYKPAI